MDLEGPKEGEVLVRIVITSLCYADVFTLSAEDLEGLFPCILGILGHEGLSRAEEVGKGVTSVKPGDNMIPLYLPEDPDFPHIKSGKTNVCQTIRQTQGAGLMPDGPSRFSYRGEQLPRYIGISTFIEYTVLTEISFAKAPKEARLSKVSVKVCAVPTEMGLCAKPRRSRWAAMSLSLNSVPPGSPNTWTQWCAPRRKS